MQEQIVRYSNCPVCNSGRLSPALTAKDHTVSGKVYDIWECHDCTLRFTQDVPSSASIGAYYQSADYISHTDSKEGIINRIYHAVRRRTLKMKRNLVASVTGADSGTLLDIGAGTGAFVNMMNSGGWNATGLEPDEQTRLRAQSLYKLELLPTDRFFGLTSGSFNAITMWHVLEHVHDLHAYVEQLKRLIKPGGKILIAVPNYTSFDGGIYQGYWAAYDVPRHLYHFSPNSMQTLLEVHGLRLETMRPMWYDSFYISILSEKYKKGSMLNGLMVAIRSNFRAWQIKERCSSLIYVISLLN